MHKLLKKFLNQPINDVSLRDFGKVRKLYKKYKKTMELGDKLALKAKITEFEDQFRSDPADLPF